MGEGHGSSCRAALGFLVCVVFLLVVNLRSSPDVLAPPLVTDRPDVASQSGKADQISPRSLIGADRAMAVGNASPGPATAIKPSTRSGAIAPKDDYSPFRHITREIAARSWQKLLGPRPALGAAVCELMVLANPSCEAFLTGERISHHPDGAMMECLEETGGPAAWESVLQAQCLTSTFWGEMKERWAAAPPPLRKKKVPSMDPIMRSHVGPLNLSRSTSMATFHEPITCRPPPLDAEERRIAQSRNVTPLLIPGNNYTIPIFPFSFGFPRELAPHRTYKFKLWDWMPIIPSYYPMSRRKFKNRAPRTHYTATADDEWLVLIMYRLSYFAWTHARGGPDCMRHYEILASGAVPYFFVLPLYSNFTLSGLPKQILLRALRLPGVEHLDTIERLVSRGDMAAYKMETMPPDAFQLRFKRDRLIALKRLLHNKNNSNSSDLEFEASAWMTDDDYLHLAQEEYQEEMYGERLIAQADDVPHRKIRHLFSPLEGDHYFRLENSPVFNIKALGNINHDKFDRDAYFALADELLGFSKEKLTCGAVMNSVLERAVVRGRMAGNYSRSLHLKVLIFVAPRLDHTGFTIQKGLSELGVSAFVVETPEWHRRNGEEGKVLNEMWRSIGPTGMAAMSPMHYAEWIQKEKLPEMYGKNFLMGKRIPTAPLPAGGAASVPREQNGVHWRLPSVRDACALIQNGFFDVIILQVKMEMRFSLHPCAEEIINERKRSGVTVVAIDGNDEMAWSSVVSMHEAGVVVFAREPSCW